MERLMNRNWLTRPVLRGMTWILGGLASIAAVAVGAVLAVVFAATFVVVGCMAVTVMGLSLAAFKARRSAMAGAESDVIEAHNVGGHSWVAYGWDLTGR